jgi:hypothetical protein
LLFKEERLYIEAHIASRNEGTELPFPPFLSIMATPAFLALVAVHFGNNWGLFTLLTEIPTYLNNIQHFSLKTVNNHLTNTFCYSLFGESQQNCFTVYCPPKILTFFKSF